MREPSQILVKARKWCNSRQHLHAKGNIKLTTLAQFPSKNARLEIKDRKKGGTSVPPFSFDPQFFREIIPFTVN